MLGYFHDRDPWRGPLPGLGEIGEGEVGRTIIGASWC